MCHAITFRMCVKPEVLCIYSVCCDLHPYSNETIINILWISVFVPSAPPPHPHYFPLSLSPHLLPPTSKLMFSLGFQYFFTVLVNLLFDSHAKHSFFWVFFLSVLCGIGNENILFAHVWFSHNGTVMRHLMYVCFNWVQTVMSAFCAQSLLERFVSLFSLYYYSLILVSF